MLSEKFSQFRSTLIRVCALAFVISAFVSFSVLAQGREDEKHVNLKVLDSTISHEALIELMNHFTEALGVGCDFCHVRKDGGKSRDFDFPADSLHEKLAAREMLLMTNAINANFIAKSSHLDSPAMTVQCITCHRGQPHPRQINDVLTKARTEKGMAGLDSTYRALRTKYYGSQTFDFGERTMVHLAFELSEENPADAMALMILNREFNPASAFNEWAIGQMYLDKGDTAQAIAQCKKALELNPNFRRAKRDLEVLGVKVE
jgi:Photosynthetic reaction centre cytochrome C subunit/Tetratricopeptide repeat